MDEQIREAKVDALVHLVDGLVPGGLKDRELLVVTALVSALSVCVDLGRVEVQPTG